MRAHSAARAPLRGVLGALRPGWLLGILLAVFRKERQDVQLETGTPGTLPVHAEITSRKISTDSVT